MAVSLLDVNVLLALAWPNHVHHDAAHRWFAAQRSKGWATCPHTQLSFLRLSTQPAVVKTTVTMADAIGMLRANLAAAEHNFWPLDFSVTEMLPEIQSRLIGPQQVADAMLLDLAIKRHGKLATFDRGIANLLTPDSGHNDALEIVNVE